MKRAAVLLGLLPFVTGKGSNTEVLVIGAGAAGISAGRTLHEDGVDFLVLEAESR